MYNRHHIGSNTADLHIGEPKKPYRRVMIIAGDDADGNQIVYRAYINPSTNQPTAASTVTNYNKGGGEELVIENPYGTQQMAIDILEQIAGYEYQPYTSSGALVPDTAELGDIVDIGSIMSVIATQDIEFGGLSASTISAPGEDETDNEFGSYLTKAERDVIRETRNMATEFSAQMGEIRSAVQKNSRDIVGITSQTSEFVQTESSITATVAQSMNKYAIPDGITIDLYGFGPPDDKLAAEHSGEFYLDQSTGKYYKSDGKGWKVQNNDNPFKLITAELSTVVKQTASGLSLEITNRESAVEGAKDYADGLKGDIEKEDGTLTKRMDARIKASADAILAQLAKSQTSYSPAKITASNPNAQINYGYMSDNATSPPLDASGYSGQFYVNVSNGDYYYSDGKKWNKVGTLDLVTSDVSSSFQQTADSITTLVQWKNTIDQNGGAATVNGLSSAIETYVSSSIKQYADTVSMQVQGNAVANWISGTIYYPGDFVKIPQVSYDPNVNASGYWYYECTYPHIANSENSPYVNSTYWTKLENPPTVSNMIEASLQGIMISSSATDPSGSSTGANSAYIRLSKGNIDMGGGTITLSDVQVNSIAANTSIQSPLIYNANRNILMTLDGTYPGPGVDLSIFAGSNYYQFFKISRINNDTWFTFDGTTRLIATSSGMQAMGTWDFSGATVILPS